MKDYITAEGLNQFIDAALKEDVGVGDHSTLASVPADQQGKANLLIKEKGIIAGLTLAERIFSHFDPNLTVNLLMNDGDAVNYGDIGLTVSGSAQSILTTERLVLNCMQRMSGIATKTHHFNQLIQHTDARLLDTRKTTPNFRMLEKWAVAIGGGQNHRYALYDMIMLKDNHIDFAGGIAEAINATNAYLKKNRLDLKVEIETRNLKEVKAVLDKGGVDIIMLDNMSPKEMKEAVALIDKQYITEASGGINENTIVDVAESGVDFISVGALTHQVQSLDISLKAVKYHPQTAD
ncbi:carboxylating nicotinate-nucleotide diphosphorylase [Cyclobacterium marinum]|uniref:Probable nicotinate-nucleotide pyrophosphorylase [carboxylating] n=1 Tax=Cyclobacterium marinum (strain ATCC 25205 / DSM 745 / LMG 13164 / NCIMB 1802) TaxID=880070 RepID=G0IWX8_CYCMS|nr:carboxylating nicotinate-nucleotide diphosphorylase [Cyclobacterium marinum]AEL24896.1 nicotinate-nucleotide pyrophosphorylase [Cyclobacterium marinum DSM 745]MBR9776396.1 carboxylating nicotinate-nucleotide diphosphorylase [Cytophagales bacterium]|tara:strand:- start:80883 stop:81761 length:879 start_codon:yes stop_codon:yes gene_type:complete